MPESCAALATASVPGDWELGNEVEYIAVLELLVSGAVVAVVVGSLGGPEVVPSSSVSEGRK